jgi:predicted Co/Zn/Cd cation transporter (cation efflux family)
MKTEAKIEQRALTLSMVSIIFFNGVYSLIGLGIAGVTLWVSRLAERPDDEKFHFGYTRFEPLLNVGKSLFIKNQEWAQLR